MPQRTSKRLLFAGTIFLLAAACQRQPTVRSQPETTPAHNAAVVPHSAALPVPPVPALPVHRVGQVSRHAQNFLGQRVHLQGYVLKKEQGYVLVSDEAGGAISMYDLPVEGAGTAAMQPKVLYDLEGTFVHDSQSFSNKSPNHLQLEIPPTPAT